MSVNLGRTDQYDSLIIPDGDIETCLKVLRTLRNITLRPESFNAHRALVLSEAHQVIYNLVQEAQE